MEISERPYATARWERVGESVLEPPSTRRVVLPGAAFVRYARLTRVRSTPVRKPAAAVNPQSETIVRSPESQRPSVSRKHSVAKRADLTLLWLVLLAIVFLFAQRLIGIR